MVKGKKRKIKQKEVNLSERLISSFQKRSITITVIILIITLFAGTYIRMLPAIKYKLELDASDPWILYWMAKYFYVHGPLNLNGLKDVKTFWWPQGRDFLRSEYIGIPWITAVTYPLVKHFGLSLRQWISLVPVISGALSIVMIFFFVYYLLKSKLAGIISAVFFAIMPGAVVRTTAGFVEKIGAAVPVIMLSYIFLAAAFKNDSKIKRPIYSFLGGLIGGFVAWLWGGYHLETATFALTLLLDLILYKPTLSKFLRLHLPLFLGYFISVSLSPEVGYYYFEKSVGLVFLGALIFYLIGISFEKLIGRTTTLLRFWLVVTFVFLGIATAVSGAASLSGRMRLVLGLTYHLNPLETSVQEYTPPSWKTIFVDYGLALLLGLGAIIIDLYRLYESRRKGVSLPSVYPFRLSILIIFLFLIYVNKHMYYIEQMASFYAILAAGIFTGFVITGEISSSKATGKAGKKVKKKIRMKVPSGTLLSDSLRLAGALTIIIMTLAGAVIYAQQTYFRNEYHAPSIMTSMLGALTLNVNGKPEIVVPLNDAWINALKFINESTPSNALIVSWWDYGYWITVNTNRRTLADGATLNGTQIRLLAQILTAPEHQASGLLKLIGAKPNDTYVVFYDAFRGLLSPQGVLTVFPLMSFYPSPVNRNMYFIVYGVGDLAKSFQMLRIGYRISNPYTKTPFNTSWYATSMTVSNNVYYMFPGFVGNPQKTAEKVRNALLYKLTIYGLYHILDHPITNKDCLQMLKEAKMVSPSVPVSQYNIAKIPPVNVTDFKLVAEAIGCPKNTVMHVSGGYTSFILVIVFIYKWTG